MNKEKRRVPKLRFPGFTEDWEQRKLRNLLEQPITDGPHETPELYDSGIPFISVDAIVDNKIDFTKMRGYISKEYDDICAKKYKPQINDVYLVKSGATIGKVAIVETYDNFNIWSPLAAMRCGSITNPYFLYMLLQTQDLQSQVFNKASHGTQPNLSMRQLETFICKVPKIEEQKLISRFLKQLDDVITLHQRKLEHLKLKKKALLQKLFPKNGERYPELRFPGFTDAWEQRKLGDIATFSKGNGYSKSDLTPSGDPIILYGRLYTNYETTISNVDTFVELKDKSVISQGGEVIVPASGETAEDISRASVVKNQGIIIGGDLNVIKVNHLLDPTFLALTISNGEQQKELSKRAQGKSVVHLHNSDLQEVNLTFPLLNEQKEISTLFEKMDNIITLHQRKLGHLQLQKKALLQQMFV